jgi:hypothetical protein
MAFFAEMFRAIATIAVIILLTRSLFARSAAMFLFMSPGVVVASAMIVLAAAVIGAGEGGASQKQTK